VGLPLFLWFSTRLFSGLRAALNEVFDTDERRSWPVAKLLDLAMVLGTGTLLVLGALVATWEARNAGSVSRSFALDWMWRLSLELISFALAWRCSSWSSNSCPAGASCGGPPSLQPSSARSASRWPSGCTRCT